MNIKLIKKYKDEFNLWLEKDNAILCCLDDKDENWFTVGRNTKIWNSDYNLPIKHIIIKDEYVEFRKALAKGKTVQYYVDGFAGWQDVTTVGNHCVVGAKNYRIKPEEQHFKVGDFVRVTSPSGEKFVSVITEFHKTNSSVTLNRESVAYISDCKLWEPEYGELCWFTNNKDSKSAVLCKFDSYEEDKIVFKFKNIRKKSFVYCEPFLNSKPSWFKD